ncbi:MAG: DivIVA domain-containing protein [Firmicutes bacterium]|nr:DivIVA domain-containing protein [Bacillota bacterium]
MEQEPLADQQATPIFNAYRRGYDPEQVDRYVADQQRRLDEALKKASVAERRLGAAVGQLRELNKRVATLESQERPIQAPALDTLGERIQRILTEAWEGAYAIRQSAEQEVQELKSDAEAAASEIINLAEERVKKVEEQLKEVKDRQMHELEQERAKAVAQISYLHEQKKLAMTDLLKLRDVITSTLAENLPPSLVAKYRQMANATEQKAVPETPPEPPRPSAQQPVGSTAPVGRQSTSEELKVAYQDRAENIAEEVPESSFDDSYEHAENDIPKVQDELDLTMPIASIRNDSSMPHIGRQDISELVRRHREANKRLVESASGKVNLESVSEEPSYDGMQSSGKETVDSEGYQQNQLYDFTDEA